MLETKARGLRLVYEYHTCTSILVLILHLNSETLIRGARLVNCRHQLYAGRAVSGSEHCLNFTSGWV